MDTPVVPVQEVVPITPVPITSVPITPVPITSVPITSAPVQEVDPCCSTSCCNSTINKMCFKLYKDRSDIESVLNNIDLPHIQKQHIQARYINMLENFKKRVRKYSIIFFTGHFIITVGSLFVPALLSIQNSNVNFSINGYSIPVYIITFIVSLLVTIFNGILTLFKIDKKYYFLNTTMERLRSEGWQYLGLSGRYSGKLQNIVPTHTNQFLYFTHQIEKIKMKQVEEEFYKTNEPESKDPGKPNELYPPSLTQSITSLASAVPEPVREAMQSIIKSQNIVSEQTVMDGLNMLQNKVIEYSDKFAPANTIIMPSKSTTLGSITPIIVPSVVPSVVPIAAPITAPITEAPVVEGHRTYRDVVIGSPSNNV